MLPPTPRLQSVTPADAIDLRALLSPFPAAAVEWLVIESTLYDGKPVVTVAPFLDARSIMERLDEVVGPGGWATDVKAAPNSLDGLIYGLSVLVNGQWVTKYDGADIPAQGGTNARQADRTKSALTSALRRAAMVWGVGRYLWSLPKKQRAVLGERKSDATPFFHVIKPKGQDKWQPMKVWWGPPALPAWALPVASPEAPRLVGSTSPQAAPSPSSASGAAGTSATPRCPACTSAMYDNRQDNARRDAILLSQGKAPPTRAAFKCRNAECQLKLLDSDVAGGGVSMDALVRLGLEPAVQ